MQSKRYTNVLDDSAGFLLGVTYRKMTNLFHQRLKPYGITSEQWIVLYCIHENHGLMQKDIAERTSKDRPTITRILDALSSKGLIKKEAGIDDRRSNRIYASDEGKALIEETADIEHRTVAEATAGLSTEEYELLIKLLNQIGETIKRL